MAQIIGIIPARYASTRFPGKPLADIGGMSMIERVYRQAQKASLLNAVIVATDDERIADHVRGFGGKVAMTSANHQSGSDRCAEVLTQFPDAEVVINIQGDEPFIDPEQINLLAACFSDSSTQIATLVKQISSQEDVQNSNVVKAVLNLAGEAIYFSRSPIPYKRNANASVPYYKHIGIYGYRSDVLSKITCLPVSRLEEAESLEQLRWIENGFRIRARETTLETVSVDTPEDLELVDKILKS